MSLRHKSELTTGFRFEFFQPFEAHFVSQPSVKAWWTYCESVWMSTSQGTFSASRPFIAAVTSIRLLVVSASAPVNTFSAPCFEEIRSAAQPPTPGFGEHPLLHFLCCVRRRTRVDHQAQSRESAVLSLRCQLRAF